MAIRITEASLRRIIREEIESLSGTDATSDREFQSIEDELMNSKGGREIVSQLAGILDGKLPSDQKIHEVKMHAKARQYLLKVAALHGADRQNYIENTLLAGALGVGATIMQHFLQRTGTPWDQVFDAAFALSVASSIGVGASELYNALRSHNSQREIIAILNRDDSGESRGHFDGKPGQGPLHPMK